MFDLRMPKVSLGDDDDETALVAQWLIAEGESFDEGDAILEVETAKANMEVEAPHGGVLAVQVAAVGTAVAPGDVLAVLADSGEHYDAEAIRDQQSPRPSKLQAAQESAESPADQPVPAVTPADPEPVLPQPITGPKRAPDADASSAESVGPSFEQAGELYGFPQHRRPRVQAPPGNETVNGIAPLGAPQVHREPLSRHRRALAKTMLKSAAIPQFSVHRDLPMELAQRTVTSLRVSGVPATMTDVILKATAEALIRHPEANGLFIDDDYHRYSEPAIALAADSPAGVVAPVIRNCHRLGWADLARERKRVVEGARNGRLLPADMSGGTFSISNVGALGGDLVIPMLTPPQVAILGLGRIRPGWGGHVATAVLVADHRALDGADAARFLNSLAEIISSIPDAVAEVQIHA